MRGRNGSAVPYIYEFDLEGFFDNVDLNYIKRICQEDLGMPSSRIGFVS